MKTPIQYSFLLVFSTFSSRISSLRFSSSVVFLPYSFLNMPTFTARSTPESSPIKTCPNSPISNLRHHPNYYLPGGDLFIQIDDALFCVHSYFFIRESSRWLHFLRTSPKDVSYTTLSSSPSSLPSTLYRHHILSPNFYGCFTIPTTAFMMSQSQLGGTLRYTPPILKWPIF